MLGQPPVSVMMKDKVAASGDKHDYLSQARYVWPDPTKPDGMMRRLCDSSRIHDLGWRSTISLEQGIEKLYRWYLQNQQEGMEPC